MFRLLLKLKFLNGITLYLQCLRPVIRRQAEHEVDIRFGDLGDEAYRFADFLAQTGQRLWQILPLGPAGYGNSPYQSLSGKAGNYLLISPEKLLHDGFLKRDDLNSTPDLPDEYVDYSAVIDFKNGLFRKSFEYFNNATNSPQQEEFRDFCTQNASWLDTYSLFMALKTAFELKNWTGWDNDIKRREPEAIRY